MKKSAVNMHLFIRDIKRSWPVWAGMCFAYVVTYLPTLLSERYADISRFTLEFLGAAIPVADFLLVLLVFGFMNNSRSANFFFSLPIKRGNLFLTKTLACMVVTFIPALIAGLIPIMAHPGDPAPVYLLAHILLAHVTFLGTALFCMMMIGQSIAFVAISTIFQFTAIGLHTIIESIIRASIYGFDRSLGIYKIIDYLTPVSHYINASSWNGSENIYYTIDGVMRNTNNDQLLSSVLMALGGLALGILAVFAFKKRKAESAGDILVFKFTQPIFKYCVAFCSALLFTMIILSSFNLANGAITHGNLPIVCLLLVINTALGYFITEMLIQKKFNVFKKTWKGCAVIAAVIVAAMCFIEFDMLDVENSIPDIDSITMVRVVGSWGAYYDERGDIENAIALHEFLLAHKDDIESSKINYYSTGTVRVPTGLGNTEPAGDERNRADRNENNADYYSEYFHNFFNARYANSFQINYTLKDGKTLNRSYPSGNLLGDEAATLEMSELYYKLAHTYRYGISHVFWRGSEVWEDDEDITVSVVSDKISTKLDKSMTRELYDAVLADMRDLNLGVDDYAPLTAERPATLMDDRIEFKIMVEETYTQHGSNGRPSYSYTQKVEQMWAYCTLDTRAKNTLAVLEKAGIEVN